MEKIIALSRDSIVNSTKDQVVSVELAGEAVLLNLNAGIYYGLDAISAGIWGLIQEPIAVSRLVEVLVTEYEVESGQCETDVLTLLTHMADNGLIEIKNGPVA